MCAGCPGGRAVSRSTAYVNAHGLKPRVLAALRQRVGGRAAVTVFGDRWVLRSRTGAQQVFPDLEDLVRALTARGLVDRDGLPDAAAGEELVAALLAGAAAAPSYAGPTGPTPPQQTEETP